MNSRLAAAVYVMHKNWKIDDNKCTTIRSLVWFIGSIQQIFREFPELSVMIQKEREEKKFATGRAHRSNTESDLFLAVVAKDSGKQRRIAAASSCVLNCRSLTRFPTAMIKANLHFYKDQRSAASKFYKFIALERICISLQALIKK